MQRELRFCTMQNYFPFDHLLNVLYGNDSDFIFKMFSKCFGIELRMKTTRIFLQYSNLNLDSFCQSFFKYSCPIPPLNTVIDPANASNSYRQEHSWDIKRTPFTGSKHSRDAYVEAVKLWKHFQDTVLETKTNKIPTELRGVYLISHLYGRARDLV